MILVDDRAGSAELCSMIRQLTPNVIMTRLEFGDLAWVGNGPDGVSLRFGIEYKRIDDVLTCMVDGRFADHQLPGLLRDYDRVWLVVVGDYREDPATGVLQRRCGSHERRHGEDWRDYSRGRRGFMRRELDHWFLTMEMQAGIRVKEFMTPALAVKWMVRCHSWAVNKDWDEHKSLHQFHVSPPPTAPLVKHGLLRRWAKELGGVGWDKSASVAAYFKSALQMAVASERQWAEVDGIGKILSKRIVAEIRGGGDGRPESEGAGRSVDSRANTSALGSDGAEPPAVRRPG